MNGKRTLRILSDGDGKDAKEDERDEKATRESKP